MTIKTIPASTALDILPTSEMIRFFEDRTRAHIARVRDCLLVMASASEHAAELRERAEFHDASKFGPEERDAYVWLTEFHRCRRAGIPFTYPDGVAEQVKAATKHHVQHNRHHPEFHANPNKMSEADLIEMVCDWTAMAQEYGEENGSARGWAEKTVGVRFKFDETRRRFIFETIGRLDKLIAGPA